MKVHTKQSTWGTLRTDRKPAFLRFLDVLLIILIAVAAGASYWAASEGLPFWIGLVVIPVVLPLYLVGRVKCLKVWKAFCKQMNDAHIDDEEDAPEALPALSNDEKFYNKCVENQITNLDVAGIARIKLLAKQLNMDCSELELIEKYQNGQRDMENRRAIFERNQQRLKLKSLREQEQQEECVCKRYMDSVGSAKRVNECTDNAMKLHSEIRKLKAEAEEYTKKMGAIGAVYTQKETDWALHGGIASGIAGPTAGVAVATDIQRRNEQIRASNEQINNLVSNAAASYLVQNREKINIAEEQAKFWEDEAEKAKLKLVEEKTQEALLAMLNPKVTGFKRSETGAMVIRVSTDAVQLNIYETVNATVDGTFKVKLMDETCVAGEAYFTLPFKGSEKNADLTSICTSVCNEEKDYTFEFAPQNLCAIEL